jgi:hypothetical protein
MITPTLVTRLVLCAGVLHFTQLPAMAMAGRLLDWRGQLRLLDPLNRSLVLGIGVGIMIAMTGLGVLVVCRPASLVNGDPMGRLLAAFLAVFLGYRALVQWVAYGPIWPRRRLGRGTHWLLGLQFTFQAIVYLLAFWRS